jgi:TPR repeat protein
VLYMTGDGVPKDLKEARKWLTAAASKGNTTARFYLDRLDD